jgi:hypothetical protein
MATVIKTSSWFIQLPAGHVRIGISRGVPRRHVAGYRVFRKLAPRTWFDSIEPLEYARLYRTEILAPLDPRVVAATLIERARGGTPVMCCYERAGSGDWCHRAIVAEWLAEALGEPFPEVGFETLPQGQHPLMPLVLRRPIAAIA